MVRRVPQVSPLLNRFSSFPSCSCSPLHNDGIEEEEEEEEQQNIESLMNYGRGQSMKRHLRIHRPFSAAKGSSRFMNFNSISWTETGGQHTHTHTHTASWGNKSIKDYILILSSKQARSCCFLFLLIPNCQRFQLHLGVFFLLIVVNTILGSWSVGDSGWAAAAADVIRFSLRAKSETRARPALLSKKHICPFGDGRQGVSLFLSLYFMSCL